MLLIAMVAMYNCGKGLDYQKFMISKPADRSLVFVRNCPSFKNFSQHYLFFLFFSFTSVSNTIPVQQYMTESTFTSQRIQNCDITTLANRWTRVAYSTLRMRLVLPPLNDEWQKAQWKLLLTLNFFTLQNCDMKTFTNREARVTYNVLRPQVTLPPPPPSNDNDRKRNEGFYLHKECRIMISRCWRIEGTCILQYVTAEYRTTHT